MLACFSMKMDEFTVITNNTLNKMKIFDPQALVSRLGRSSVSSIRMDL